MFLDGMENGNKGPLQTTQSHPFIETPASHKGMKKNNRTDESEAETYLGEIYVLFIIVTDRFLMKIAQVQWMHFYSLMQRYCLNNYPNPAMIVQWTKNGGGKMTKLNKT